MESELYKLRSVGGCVKAASNLMFTNLRTLFRRSWVAALLFSVALGALLAVDNSANVGNVGVAIMILLLIVVAAAYVWFYTIIASLLNGASVKANLPRVVRLALALAGVGVVAGVVVSLVSLIPYIGVKDAAGVEKASMVSVAVMAVVATVLMLLLLPLNFSAMKYTIETDSKLPMVFRQYIVGAKHWGYLFMLALVSGLILFVAEIVSSLPLMITLLGAQMDGIGVTMGDVSGLPPYFAVLTFIAGAIAFFIEAYLNAWWVMVFYYGYGHIESKSASNQK